ncbi:MAG: ATP-dependent Clp protease proteolytic subunit [Acidobacteria bacterium]|nr:ATP-dependent Clp protease proteolytic subunit [Acidobacteriota bacterium]MBI3423993.1 ATP-dependent Clp protease proteolytic subunit [Acidobacteriota bacterium]
MKTPVFYLNFPDAITVNTVKILMSACTEIINNQHPATLYLSMSSRGGDIAAGITLFNYLRALPLDLITHNIGVVDSIATIIFLAGKERFASSNATFLFHGVQLSIQQPTLLSVTQTRELLSGIEADENKLANIYQTFSRLTETEVRELYTQGATKDAKFALDKGVIDEIKDFIISPGSSLISLNIAA